MQWFAKLCSLTQKPRTMLYVQTHLENAAYYSLLLQSHNDIEVKA